MSTDYSSDFHSRGLVILGFFNSVYQRDVCSQQDHVSVSNTCHEPIVKQMKRAR